MRKKITFISIVVLIIGILFGAVTVFFDQAILHRKGTFFRGDTTEKVVALTFDDGPSPEWTPQILDGLKKHGVKATFFMLGKHVLEYPEVAKRVAKEGHEIGNHTYDHRLLIFVDGRHLEKEILDAGKAIKDVTGKDTRLFRPPKGWMTSADKRQINKLGYQIILWSLNSKDWVTFDDKRIVKYIVRHVRPGDIILFHDGGGAFRTEGGNRTETIKVIPRLIEKLKERGYRLVTVSELMALSERK
jgi:peptidoglycan/xylan/chitin deacetylase (PgdA/CDA1 family)